MKCVCVRVCVCAGYTSEGEKVMKTLKASEVDALLAKADDPEHWKKIKDIKNQREITLTDTDIEVGRLPTGRRGQPHNVCFSRLPCMSVACVSVR